MGFYGTVHGNAAARIQYSEHGEGHTPGAEDDHDIGVCQREWIHDMQARRRIYIADIIKIPHMPFIDLESRSLGSYRRHTIA